MRNLHARVIGFKKDKSKEVPIEINGAKSPHGIFMHPKQRSYATVSYPLRKRYTRFQATAAIPQVLPAQGDPVTPLVFEVRGNGTVLWKSQPLKEREQTEECDIEVGGINRLELRVNCPGKPNWAFACWLEPRLIYDEKAEQERREAAAKAERERREAVIAKTAEFISKEKTRLGQEFGFNKLDYTAGPNGEKLEERQQGDEAYQGFVNTSSKFVKHGRYTHWSTKPPTPDSARLSEGWYYNGKAHGVVVWRDKHGPLTAIFVVENGVRQGLYRE